MDSRPTGQAQYGTLLSPSLYPSMLVSLWITGVSTSKATISSCSCSWVMIWPSNSRNAARKKTLSDMDVILVPALRGRRVQETELTA